MIQSSNFLIWSTSLRVASAHRTSIENIFCHRHSVPPVEGSNHRGNRPKQKPLFRGALTLVYPTGFEPTTFSTANWRSIQLSYGYAFTRKTEVILSLIANKIQCFLVYITIVCITVWRRGRDFRVTRHNALHYAFDPGAPFRTQGETGLAPVRIPFKPSSWLETLPNRITLSNFIAKGYSIWRRGRDSPYHQNKT